MRTATIALAYALSILFQASPVKAEITNKNQTNIKRAIEQAPMHVRCWQNGILILEQDGVEGLNLAPLLNQKTLTLRQEGKTDTSFIITAMGESLCALSSVSR